MAQHKRHAATRRWRSPWLVGGAVVIVVAAAVGGVAFANSEHAKAVAAAHQRAAARARAEAAAAAAARARLVAQLEAAVVISPAPGTTGVAPDAPVSVKTSQGQLSTVQVTASSGGSPLAGALAAGGQAWQASAAALSTGTTYKVSGQVTGPGGVSAPFHSTFTTLTPSVTVHNTLFPYGGQTVGVGQPVIVKFNHDIYGAANRASAISHFTVRESNPVPGGWYWFSPDELHFRPQNYWPTGEQVEVISNLAGWDAGHGMWGAGTVDAHFVIGAAHVATANLATHQMTVTNNGATVATYPISGGSDQYPTMNGVHIAMDKEPVVHMVSSTVGIPVNSPAGYDEMVYSDVHISDSGEYVHAAPWSVASQGHTNVSHGCINLAPSDAKAFFDFSQIGDVVVVTGGPRPPVTGDHGVMDWTTPYSQWTPGTVVPLTPPAPAAPSTTSTTAPAA